MKKTLVASLGLITLSLMCLSFTHMTDNKPWVVPDTAKAKKNPVAADASTIGDGKSLYTLHCASCHGKKGKGDGPKAAQLETECGDLSASATQSQSDGSIFYKIEEGRDDMPSFKKKIADQDDVWSVVNYVRTLKQ